MILWQSHQSSEFVPLKQTEEDDDGWMEMETNKNPPERRLDRMLERGIILASADSQRGPRVDILCSVVYHTSEERYHRVQCLWGI